MSRVDIDIHYPVEAGYPADHCPFNSILRCPRDGTLYMRLIVANRKGAWVLFDFKNNRVIDDKSDMPDRLSVAPVGIKVVFEQKG